MATPDLLGLPLELREKILEYVMLPRLTVTDDTEQSLGYFQYWEYENSPRIRSYNYTSPFDIEWMIGELSSQRAGQWNKRISLAYDEHQQGLKGDCLLVKFLLICRQIKNEVITVFGRHTRPYLKVYQNIFKTKAISRIDATLRNVQGFGIRGNNERIQDIDDMWSRFQRRMRNSQIRSRPQALFSVKRLGLGIVCIENYDNESVSRSVRKILDLLVVFPELRDIHLDISLRLNEGVDGISITHGYFALAGIAAIMRIHTSFTHDKGKNYEIDWRRSVSVSSTMEDHLTSNRLVKGVTVTHRLAFHGRTREKRDAMPEKDIVAMEKKVAESIKNENSSS